MVGRFWISCCAGVLGLTAWVCIGADQAVLGPPASRPTTVSSTQGVVVDGMLAYPRSKAQIIGELNRIAKVNIPTLEASEPIPAHDGGDDTPQDRQEAVRLLMQYRFLCYVPYDGMALDPVYCAHNQAASALLKTISKLDHFPPNPGWPEDRYQYALEGTSHSNIYAIGGDGPRCRRSVHAYMDDSDKANVGVLGHRRSCLSPYLGKVGFGSFKDFSTMWIQDRSRAEIPDYDYIAYPAAGFFPVNYCDAHRAWSISLNPQHFARPAEADVKVTVTPVRVRLIENKIEPLGKPLDMECFHVDTAGWGVADCIIFRPLALRTDQANAYVAEVVGLRSKDGKAATIKYLVEFFKP